MSSTSNFTGKSVSTMQVELGDTSAVWTFVHLTLVPQYYRWLDQYDAGNLLCTDLYMRRGFEDMEMASFRAHLDAERVMDLGSNLLMRTWELISNMQIMPRLAAIHELASKYPLTKNLM